MADIKTLYINADGLAQEHSQSGDSVKFLSFKTANKELTDAKLAHLIDGADSQDEHIHDLRYFRKNEFINTSTGAADAGKPIITDANGKLNTNFINIPVLNPLLSHSALLNLAADDHPQYLKTDGTRDITGLIKYSTVVNPTDDKQLVPKKYVDDAIFTANMAQEWYDSALTRTVTPPASPATGARYLIDGTLGTPTGVWSGKANQVATWNGTAYTYQVPSQGSYISIDNEPTALYNYSGSSWVVKNFEVSTASTGLVKIGFDIQIDPAAAGDGLGFTSGVLKVNVDGSSIETNADTLRVKALGIKDTMIDFGTGALQVSALDLPVADAGNYFATKNTEFALQYLAMQALIPGVDYLAAAGGVTKGDLLYVTSNDTAAKFSTLTNNSICIGIAATTATAGATVRALADDTRLTGVLTGATPGLPVYWTGTGLSQAMPTGLGANVWRVGVAKNATDLHVDVEFVKKQSITL